MTDIIIRTSNGRVQTTADSISQLEDRYLATSGGQTTAYPFNSYGGVATSIVSNVSGVPIDLFPGFNYNYVSGAFVNSGVSPPPPPASGVPASGIPASGMA